MHRRIVSAALLALLLTAATLSTAAPAGADVKGDLRLVGERPVSGTFDFRYQNYKEKIRICRPHVCVFKGYKVSRGKMQLKLRTYRVLENLRRFDYYVLDVDIVNSDRGGSSNDGWTKVHVAKAGKVRWVDYGDTSSISAREADCMELGLSMGGSIGGFGASVSWGSVRFCSKQARYSIQRRTGKTTTYLAMDMRDISHFSSQRIVKVKRGKKPKFKVTLHMPTDTCTEGKDGYCVDYDNDTRMVQGKIGTNG